MQLEVCSEWTSLAGVKQRHLGLQSTRSACGACDNMTSVSILLANLQDQENFTEIVYDCVNECSKRKMVAALRQFMEVDNHKALVSVKLLEPASRCERSGGPCVRQKKIPAAKMKQGQEKSSSRAGDREAQKAFLDTTRNDQNKWRPPSG